MPPFHIIPHELRDQIFQELLNEPLQSRHLTGLAEPDSTDESNKNLKKHQVLHRTRSPSYFRLYILRTSHWTIENSW
jgi:hypothetical protein